MKQKMGLVCVAIVSLAAAQTAVAGLIEVSSTRYVLHSATGGTTQDGPHQQNGPSPYGPFNGLLEGSAIEGDNGGTNYVSQVSDVQPGLYTVTMDALASTFGDGSDFADSYAETHFEVKFSLTTPEQYSISGLAGAFGAINGETSVTTIKINNLGGGGTPTILIMDQDHDYTPFSQSGTLLPGDYSLTVNSLAIVDRTFENSWGDANAGVVGLTMTITPEPSALVLMGIGGLALIRRRRSI